MARRIPTRLVAVVVVAALAAAVTVAAFPRSASLPTLTPRQRAYLTLAEHGVAQTSRWWDAKAHWYRAVLDNPHHRRTAKLWDTNGLFEALDEIAAAQPSSQNLAAVASFANSSERYWDRNLKPIPAYAPYIGDESPHQTAWFDDNGWIGLAFLDAYKVTGTHRYLTDAERAFTFIAAEGWDAAKGGMWWDTEHPWRSGEALAAAADLAARLYQATAKASYLRAADKYIGWADEHLLKPHGVYIPTACAPYPYLIEPAKRVPTPPCGRVSVAKCSRHGGCPRGKPIGNHGGLPPLVCNGKLVGPATPANLHKYRKEHCTAAIRPGKPLNGKPTMVAMPHDGEGAMLAAITTLCETTGQQKWCKAAEKLAAAEIKWLAPFADGPQYDSVLVRGLLTLYAHDHNPRWYRFAVAIARLIETHARTGPGLYLRGWDGRPIPGSVFGMLQGDAGSIAVFADLATVAPPATRHRERLHTTRTSS